MTGQSNNSQGRGHDRLPNWNPKNGGMLISQPVTSCLTNHSELCLSRPRNNQSRRISIYALQRRPSFGFESSVSSASMTSGDPVLPTHPLVGEVSRPHSQPASPTNPSGSAPSSPRIPARFMRIGWRPRWEYIVERVEEEEEEVYWNVAAKGWIGTIY